MEPGSEKTVEDTVLGCCQRKPSSYVQLVGVLLFWHRPHVGNSRSQRSLRLRHCVHAIVRLRLLRGRSVWGMLLDWGWGGVNSVLVRFDILAIQ